MPDNSTSVVLTDDVLLQLARNKDMVKKFPFLAGAKKTSTVVKKAVKKSGCGSCGRKQRRNVNATPDQSLTSIRRQIMGLSDKDKASFRKLLKTKQVVLTVSKPGGTSKTVKWT